MAVVMGFKVTWVLLVSVGFRIGVGTMLVLVLVAWVIGLLGWLLGLGGIKFSCPVGFGWWQVLLSLSFFSNISIISFWTLLPLGVGLGSGLGRFGVGLGGLVRGTGFATAAVAPTLGGIGWGLSWGPIFNWLPLLIDSRRRRSSPPSSRWAIGCWWGGW